MKKSSSFMVFIFFLCLCIAMAPTTKSAAKKKVSLNKTKLTLTAGKTYKLKLKNNKKKVKWTSSKKSVATVTSKGKVTAKKAGTATITAKVAKKKYKCKLTVKAKKTVSEPGNTNKDTDFTVSVTPNYQANFTQLKNSILTYGTTNEDGNKVINGTYSHNSMDLTYGIVYDSTKQSFEFILLSTTELEYDKAVTGLSLSVSEASIASGAAEFKILYDSGYYGSAYSTIPLANIHSENNSLLWNIEASNIEASDYKIAELGNVFMNLSYKCWQLLLNEHNTQLSLTDLGFGA